MPIGHPFGELDLSNQLWLKALAIVYSPAVSFLSVRFKNPMTMPDDLSCKNYHRVRKKCCAIAQQVM